MCSSDLEEAGRENAEIFGFSSQEIIDCEKNGDYNPMDYYKIGRASCRERV